MKKRIWISTIASALLMIFLAVTAFAFDESEVESAIAATSKEEVAGNVFIWFLCAIGFLKISQKIDSFMASLGVNVGRTGGSMLGELLVAGRGIAAATGALGGRIFHRGAGGSGQASAPAGEAFSTAAIGPIGRAAGNAAAASATGKSPRDIGDLIGGSMYRSSLRNHGTFANSVIGAVAKGNYNTVGSITGADAAAALSSYMGYSSGAEEGEETAPALGEGDIITANGGAAGGAIPISRDDSEENRAANSPTFRDVEIGGGRITGFESVPGHAGERQFAMYNAEQYMKPSGEYTLMTCNANTEITDLIGQFIPDSEGARQQGIRTGELPRLSDIVMHPPSVYETLTGEYDESKTEDDVLQKLVEVAVGKLCEKDSSQHIRYVDSPLLEAIRYGYVCELQEPSCIANPGVLVGLNALLDNCQMITLPTGEQVRRHPDTVIIVTTNSDYAGCRDMNQSIISRMDLIYDIESPDLNTMVKRVMNVTGFNDEQEATKMAVVVRDIAERCRQTMITDGSCGMRELKSWVQSVMITKDPYESALSTVIASASADPDNRAELISSCLRPQYTETI